MITDGSAALVAKAQYKPISNGNIANVLGQRTDWLSQCVAAQHLIMRKRDANDEARRYLDPASKDERLYSVQKAFLTTLKHFE